MPARPSDPMLVPDARSVVGGPTPTDDTANPPVLLIGHGTRDAEGADECRALAADVQARLGERTVAPCFLELAQPSILDAIARCADAGQRRIVAVPCFLFGAGHVKNDLPAAFDAARARDRALDIHYGAPLGVQPEMLGAVDDRIAALDQSLPPRPRGETAILLVERGSSDPDANAQVHQLARLFWEGRDWGWVEPCFVGITRPSLEEGLARCAALGARRVLVMPYFLFTGVLVRRIRRAVDAFRERFSDLDVEVAEHLGRHPAVVDLLARRVAETEAGRVCMGCDRCKYRVALAGFEHQVGQPQLSDRDHGLRTTEGALGGVEEREAFFGGLAAQWKPRSPESLGKLRSFVETAGVAPGHHVLDVGCGTGVLLPLLAEAVGPTGRVTALDVSPQMLGAARRRNPGLPVRYLLADAAAVLEPRGSYDRVICSSVVPHFADVGTALRALAALLRPGGALLICHDLGRAQLAAVHHRHGGAVAADRLPEPATLGDVLREAGLEVVALCDTPDRFWMLAFKRGPVDESHRTRVLP